MVRDLGKRDIKLVLDRRKIIAGKSPVPHVPDDAHNLNGLVAHGRNPKKSSNRIFRAERTPCHLLVNDDNLSIAKAVVLIEEAAAKQREARYIQIFRSN